MKTLLPLIAVIFLSSGLALAADAPNTTNTAVPAVEKKLTSSQQRMADCNKEATGKKGQERRDFMSQCLRAGKPAAAPEAVAVKKPQRMKDCNGQAGEKALKGAERKAFMSECLKAK